MIEMCRKPRTTGRPSTFPPKKSPCNPSMRDTSSSRVSKLLLLPCLALSAGGFLFGMSFAADELNAAALSISDLDGDGLVDIQESILQTDSFQADSDGDGFGDLEEFTRGSDPTLFEDFPSDELGSLAMTGRVENGTYHAVSTLYVKGGDLTDASVSFGMMINSKMIKIDPAYFFSGATLSVQGGSSPGDLIYLLDTPIPESLLVALGEVSLFMTYTPGGSNVVTTAASINLVTVSGVVSQLIPTAGGGSFRPLLDDPDMPATWTPAQACIQDVTTVGNIGAIIQQEVVASGCFTIESDSYCPPDCSNLTGTVQQIVDPLALIGG